MFTIPTEDTANSPWPIFKRLLDSHDELATLAGGMQSGWTVGIVFRYGEWNRGGRGLLGTCGIPQGMGHYGKMFEWLLEERLGYLPTFLVTLNGDWWHENGERLREILLFHELLHAGQAVDKFGTPRFDRKTGEPVPTIVAHDLEEFDAVVRRYGAWKGDVVQFARALREYGEEQPDVAAAVRRRKHVHVDDTPPDAMF